MHNNEQPSPRKKIAALTLAVFLSQSTLPALLPLALAQDDTNGAAAAGGGGGLGSAGVSALGNLVSTGTRAITSANNQQVAGPSGSYTEEDSCSGPDNQDGQAKQYCAMRKTSEVAALGQGAAALTFSAAGVAGTMACASQTADQAADKAATQSIKTVVAAQNKISAADQTEVDDVGKLANQVQDVTGTAETNTYAENATAHVKNIDSQTGAAGAGAAAPFPAAFSLFAQHVQAVMNMCMTPVNASLTTNLTNLGTQESTIISESAALTTADTANQTTNITPLSISSQAAQATVNSMKTENVSLFETENSKYYAGIETLFNGKPPTAAPLAAATTAPLNAGGEVITNQSEASDKLQIANDQTVEQGVTASAASINTLSSQAHGLNSEATVFNTGIAPPPFPPGATPVVPQPGANLAAINAQVTTLLTSAVPTACAPIAGAGPGPDCEPCTAAVNGIPPLIGIAPLIATDQANLQSAIGVIIKESATLASNYDTMIAKLNKAQATLAQVHADEAAHSTAVADGTAAEAATQPLLAAAAAKRGPRETTRTIYHVIEDTAFGTDIAGTIATNAAAVAFGENTNIQQILTSAGTTAAGIGAKLLVGGGGANGAQPTLNCPMAYIIDFGMAGMRALNMGLSIKAMIQAEEYRKALTPSATTVAAQAAVTGGGTGGGATTADSTSTTGHGDPTLLLNLAPNARGNLSPQTIAAGADTAAEIPSVLAQAGTTPEEVAGSLLDGTPPTTAMMGAVAAVAPSQSAVMAALSANQDKLMDAAKAELAKIPTKTPEIVFVSNAAKPARAPANDGMDMSNLLSALLPRKAPEGPPGVKAVAFVPSTSGLTADGLHPASRSLFDIIDQRYAQLSTPFLDGNLELSAPSPAQMGGAGAGQSAGGMATVSSAAPSAPTPVALPKNPYLRK